MQLEIEQLRQLLPHQGAMCLLERVLECNETSIVCTTRTHLDPNNPLRSSGGLGSANAIEYAAQAMALHARLQARPDENSAEGQTNEPGQQGGHGVLGSVRGCQLMSARLDTYDEPLIVQASLMSGDANMALYSFEVGGKTESIATGRATVLLVRKPSSGDKQ